MAAVRPVTTTAAPPVAAVPAVATTSRAVVATPITQLPAAAVTSAAARTTTAAAAVVPAAVVPSSSATTSLPASTFASNSAASGTVGRAQSQVVPSANAEYSAGDTSQGSSSSSTFPVAAIAVIAVLGGLAALFVAYKLYRWRMARKQQKALMPEMAAASAVSTGAVNRKSMGGGGGSAAMGGYYDPASSYRSGPPSWRRSGSAFFDDTVGKSGESLAEYPTLDGGGGVDASSPTTPGSAGAGAFLLGGSNLSTNQLRQNGSRQSLACFASPAIGGNGANSARSSYFAGGARESLTPSPQFGGSSARQSFYGGAPNLAAPFGGGGGMQASRSSHRVSGAPHAARSRIEIVPPQPLGAAPGAVVASDKTTLNFSPLSGIRGSGSGSALGQEEFFDADRAARAAAQRTDFAVAQQQQIQAYRQSAQQHQRQSSSGAAGPFRDPSEDGSQSGSSYAGGPAVVGAPTSPLDKLQRDLAEEATKRGRSFDRRSLDPSPMSDRPY